MANYGTHTYTTDLQGVLILAGKSGGIGLQWEVSVTVTCTYPGCPAKLNALPEDCYPAEGPEFDFEWFELFVGKVTIVKSIDWAVAEALFGDSIWAHLFDNAVADAEENPPWPEEGDER